MIATSLAPKTNLRRPGLEILWVARQPLPLQVKAMDVDSYGDYDVDQLNEPPVILACSNTTPDVSMEEFESLYHWFLS